VGTTHTWAIRYGTRPGRIVEGSDKPTDTARAHTLEDNARMLAGLNLAVATGQVFLLKGCLELGQS
jgi:hypothetical protein